MTQITINLPDRLARHLPPNPDLLLTQLLTTHLLNPAPQPTNLENPTYQEILDLLLDRPTPDRILRFKVSDTAQTRLQTLLDKNRDASLTPQEAAELDLYEQLDTLIGFLKLRAYTA
ncbi:MAG: hypothetical protein ACFB9N_17725 [Geitlerinemataceae cyanobacterium]